MIDLNEQGDASGEVDYGQYFPEIMQTSQTLALASSTTQILPTTNLLGLETMQVAILYRLRTNHVGAAVEFLGEAGYPLKNGSFVSCTCCGKPEVRKKTLICDVCGLSFHLKCLKLRESQASSIDEWACLACSTNQGKRHWPLGRIPCSQEPQAALLSNNGSKCAGQGFKAGSGDGLEIQPSQPRDGVMAAAESPFLVDTKLPSGGSQKDKSKRQKKGEPDARVGMPPSILSNHTLDEPKTRVTRLKTLCRSKEDVQGDTGRSDIVESISAGERDSSFTSASAFSKDLDDDMEASSKDTDLERQHLQKLKEFLGQQGRSLDGEWSVSVKKRANSDKAMDVMYFSPDKQKFRSKLEVARFLGVLELRKDDANSRDSVARGRKRDVSQETQQSDGEFSELIKRRKMETDKFLELQDPAQDLEHQLPLQCMDLRVEALGVVDLRPGYNSDNVVWPVGYRCSWHDGVTGSICISEVVDGGRLPPIFRVTRRSCNVSLDSCDDGRYPKESVSENPDKSGIEVRLEAEKTGTKSELNLNHVYDEEDELSMLQGTLTSFTDGDLCVPIARDNYSQLDLNEATCPGSIALEKGSTMELNHQPKRTLQGEGDEIGEIVVESSSSWGAWRLLAEQVVKRAAELYGKGSLQLGCKHVESSLLSALGLNVSNSAEGKLHDAQFFFSKLYDWMGQDRFGFNIPVIQKYLEAQKAKLQLLRPTPPTGLPVCQKVSANFVGDLLQIWEFLCRFSDILGQKEPPSLEDLEEIVADASVIDADRGQRIYKCASQDKCFLQNDLDVVKHADSEVQDQGFFENKRLIKSKTFSSPGCSVALSASNVALLKIALSDLQQMVLWAGSDLALESKRGKKKEGEAAATIKKQSANFMPLNDLTWPEVARRYVIGLLTLNTCAEGLDISVQERRKILRCIQGDGGVLCGALEGVAAIEADTLLLAAAEKQLSRWLPGAYDKSNSEPVAKVGSDGKLSNESPSEGMSRKPAWAIVLEPVRKLATNVGARIRNCVRDALEMNPPDWARETLEWSISKEVYKGNASGPTKRAVLSVLEKVGNEKYVSPPPKVEKKVEYMVASPALVMKRCRVILRQLITTDDVRVFCNSLGGTVLGYFEKEDDNIEVPLPLVARPLDFRMIDSRLAAGSYADLHESYAADMRQLFQNVPVVFRDREDFIKIGQEMSQRFETLYEEKVIKLVNGKEEVAKLKETNQVDVTETKDAAVDHSNISSSTMSDDELQKAPWEEGVCKICGIDKDDDSTLLCDGCDAEYHIYCLEPPLSMIPEGNWYCPSCVALEQGGSNSCPVASESSRTTLQQFYQSRLSENGSILSSLVRSLDGKDYWHLSGSERVQLLKFLCDKVLESTFIRDHIDQSIEGLPELQQRLRVLLIERQASAMKGSQRVDDVPVADNIETGSKETLPKKRGRKILKSSTPTLDESTRSQSGIEFFRFPAENSSGYELDSTVGIVDGRVIDRLFQSESETALGMHQKYSDTQRQEPIQIKGSLGQTIQEAQMRSRPPEFDVPPTIIAQASRGHLEEPNKAGVICTEQNVTQIQNGDFPLQELASIDHSLHATPVNTFRCSMDLAALDDHKGPSGVLQGWKLEGQSDKGSIPLSSSNFHHGSEFEASLPNVQATPGKTALELLEAEIEKVEIELMKMAPRRDCLGRDDLGRIYWALGWAGKFPWIVVEKISAVDDNINTASCNQPSCLSDATKVSTGSNIRNAQPSVIVQPGIHEWSAYCDDESIEQLLKWLKPTIATERFLKSALAKWCLIWSSKYKKEPDKQHTIKSRSAVSVSVNTKAATILSKKFGSIPQPEAPGEEPSRKRGRKKKSVGEGKIFRCDCLELVWTTRIHCPCCHHTYDSIAELQGHNSGACSWRGFEDDGQVLVLSKAKKVKSKGQEFHPPDLSLVLKRFTLHTSNRMRIMQIGCLADKGPRFIPAPSISPLLDPSLHMATMNSLDALSDMKTLETGLCSSSTEVVKDKIQVVVESIQSIDGHVGLKENGPIDVYVSDIGLSDKPSTHCGKEPTTESHDQENLGSGSRTSEETSLANTGQSLLGILPQSQPLLVTNLWAVKRLKASLLDIESLLSIDIMEPSRSEPNRRRAWRSFVKSAASILELVQSLALLEQMVKASCLKESWCNWTTLSAAAGINTLCSLALRIYSLDAAIKYKRSSVDLDTEDSEKPNKSGRKKKTSGQV